METNDHHELDAPDLPLSEALLKQWLVRCPKSGEILARDPSVWPDHECDALSVYDQLDILVRLADDPQRPALNYLYRPGKVERADFHIYVGRRGANPENLRYSERLWLSVFRETAK